MQKDVSMTRIETGWQGPHELQQIQCPTSRREVSHAAVLSGSQMVRKHNILNRIQYGVLEVMGPNVN